MCLCSRPPRVWCLFKRKQRHHHFRGGSPQQRHTQLENRPYASSLSSNPAPNLIGNQQVLKPPNSPAISKGFAMSKAPVCHDGLGSLRILPRSKIPKKLMIQARAKLAFGILTLVGTWMFGAQICCCHFGGYETSSPMEEECFDSATSMVGTFRKGGGPTPRHLPWPCFGSAAAGSSWRKRPVGPIRLALF